MPNSYHGMKQKPKDKGNNTKTTAKQANSTTGPTAKKVKTKKTVHIEPEDSEDEQERNRDIMRQQVAKVTSFRSQKRTDHNVFYQMIVQRIVQEQTVSASRVKELRMTSRVQMLINEQSDEAPVKKRKKAPKTAPAPAALFNNDSEDESEQQVAVKKRKKAPKTAPAPAALFNNDSEDESEQQVAVKKRKKAPKTAPAPAALFNNDSEDESEQQVAVKKRKKAPNTTPAPAAPQQADVADLNPGLRILDTDSEGEDDAIEAIRTRVCHSLYARHILTVASQIHWHKRQKNIPVRSLLV